MILFEIIMHILLILCFLRQVYYLVGAIKEVFWYSTKRFLPYWLYNCYVYTALVGLLAGQYVAAFAWAAVAAYTYHVASEFINKRKEESNLDE